MRYVSRWILRLLNAELRIPGSMRSLTWRRDDVVSTGKLEVEWQAIRKLAGGRCRLQGEAIIAGRGEEGRVSGSGSVPEARKNSSLSGKGERRLDEAFSSRRTMCLDKTSVV